MERLRERIGSAETLGTSPTGPAGAATAVETEERLRNFVSSSVVDILRSDWLPFADEDSVVEGLLEDRHCDEKERQSGVVLPDDAAEGDDTDAVDSGTVSGERESGTGSEFAGQEGGGEGNANNGDDGKAEGDDSDRDGDCKRGRFADVLNTAPLSCILMASASSVVMLLLQLLQFKRVNTERSAAFAPWRGAPNGITAGDDDRCAIASDEPVAILLHDGDGRAGAAEDIMSQPGPKEVDDWGKEKNIGLIRPQGCTLPSDC